MYGCMDAFRDAGMDRCLDGCMDGCFRESLDGSWATLGLSWDVLELPYGSLGASGASLELNLRRIAAPLGRSWDMIGACRGSLRAPFVRIGAISWFPWAIVEL
jgi:hypothetical protein